MSSGEKKRREKDELLNNLLNNKNIKIIINVNGIVLKIKYDVGLLKLENKLPIAKYI